MIKAIHCCVFGLIITALLVMALMIVTKAGLASSYPRHWDEEWPKTDFQTKSINLDEVFAGGPPKDGIPSIDDPAFIPVAQDTKTAPTEPVIGLVVNGEAKAYPLRILMWHEIVNDEIGGLPVAVTYCPLCNSAVVFDRRVNGKTTSFGTTGKLRNSDMVMYDRLTESWWQQFLGEAVVGDLTGTKLQTLPARLESFENFKKRAPDGVVQTPNNPNIRSYGQNPYGFYDARAKPYPFFQGPFPDYIDPMVRVIVVDGKAWSMPVLREKDRIDAGDLVLTWTEGQASALDHPEIAKGRDVGNVIVQRKTEQGLEDAVYDVTFAFVYHAFFEQRRIVTE